MAFRRKEIKKAYYYVCFLGAKESTGLRGEQYIRPVLRQLVNIERRSEPCKVTIQVSGKGIKIIQNVPKKQPNRQIAPQQHANESQPTNGNQSSAAAPPTKQIAAQPNSTVKMEQIKHFIPDHAITSALQSEDVVCIILLLYNPLTGCECLSFDSWQEFLADTKLPMKQRFNPDFSFSKTTYRPSACARI